MRVNIVDVKKKEFYNGFLMKENGNYKLDRLQSGIDENVSAYISPGWIDVHTHIFDGFTELGIPADKVGLNNGVHIVGDAGSSGEATIKGLIKYLIPINDTKIKLWINISSIGLVHLKEGSNISYLNPEKTIKAINKYKDIICGIKVRASGDIVGNMDIQSLKLAKLVASEMNLPLMVHIGESPPIIEDVLNLLSKGDVITHCYNGKLGNPWQKDGRPIPELKLALKRGVTLDVGHGGASFDSVVCKKAISKGYKPDTISTDIHIRNINGPVINLALTMSKLLSCGMNLIEVLKAVTINAAYIIPDKNWGNLNIDDINDVTLFKIKKKKKGEMIYFDSNKNEINCNEVIIPIGVITKKTLRYFS